MRGLRCYFGTSELSRPAERLRDGTQDGGFGTSPVPPVIDFRTPHGSCRYRCSRYSHDAISTLASASRATSGWANGSGRSWRVLLS